MNSKRPAQGAGIGAPQVAAKRKRPRHCTTVEPDFSTPLNALEDHGKELAGYGNDQNLV